jgi:hypothetical protein
MFIRIDNEARDAKRTIHSLQMMQAPFDYDDAEYFGLQFEINFNYTILNTLRKQVAMIKRKLGA